MILNDEERLIKFAEERAEALRRYGIAYAFLHDTYSKHQDEIKTMTGKKFVGVDSRAEVVLDWAYKQSDEIKDMISLKYADMIIQGKKSEAIASQMEALTEALKYRVSKWKNEREATK